MVNGNETPIWGFDALPGEIQQRIAQAAADRHLTIADYLEATNKPWEPSVPLAEIAGPCLESALLLRQSLEPALARMSLPSFSPAELIRMGLEAYQRTFGYSISERHWRRLLDRTLKRDAGANKFDRLEIYLPENPVRKTQATQPAPVSQSFGFIADFIGTFADPSNPSESDIAALFATIFDATGAKEATKREWKRLRKAISKELQRLLPGISATERALRVSVDRKYRKWLGAGENSSALLDGRRQKRGVAVGNEFPQEDVDIIVGHAAFHCEGRLGQAIRELAQKGENSKLTPKTLELIMRPHKSKSYVPARLRDRVAHEIEMVRPLLLGKRAQDDAKAHLQRDYTKLASMEVVNADDFTFPVYFYVPDGQGWYTLTRGQCLIMLDVRSWRIIAWSLQPERNYNSLTIRTLMNRVCADLCIPGTWYFERGIWQRSHLVKGTAPKGWKMAGSLGDLQTGWENLGVKFKHAIRARTKPVERVGGLLQDRMQGLRGYCGRDERRDCPEHTSRAMADVKFKRVNHPGELFFSFEEWHQKLGEIIKDYNASSQEGQVLQGLSPDEAFEKFMPHDNPPVKLDANSWHLVAHYMRQVTVTTNGISFRIGSKNYIYRNARTGQDRGKTVLAWFDPESPDNILVTDQDRKHPYLVERSYPVDFLATSNDPAFQAEIAKAAAHSSFPKARFNTLKSKVGLPARRNLLDIETAETAQEMTRQREQFEATQKQAAIETLQARNNYGRLGMAQPKRLRPGQLESAKKLAQILGDEDGETDNRTEI